MKTLKLTCGRQREEVALNLSSAAIVFYFRQNISAAAGRAFDYSSV